MFKTIFRGTATEFRFRILIHLLLFFLAFFAPWNKLFGFSGQILWSAAGFAAMRAGLADFGLVTQWLTVVAVVLAVMAAVFRVWGAAYIGTSIVHDSSMHTGAGVTGVIADGPYRYVRNPLYLGTILFTLPMTLLMPVSGAIFAAVTIVFFNLRLIGGEEEFLLAKLGAPYLEYMTFVPRLWPSLRPRVPASGAKALWLQAFFGEGYFIGVALVFLTLSWQYNGHLLGRALLILLGVWFVLRGFMPMPKPINKEA